MLSQSGEAGLTRKFIRPKGFVSLAWKASPLLDLSVKLEREVGQLDFFDFVASANVSGGTTDAGNVNLVPQQSWNLELEATRNLGAWGTATARLSGSRITDIVDIVPIGDRTRVVSGKSVSVRLDLGGRRIIKKKNKK